MTTPTSSPRWLLSIDCSERRPRLTAASATRFYLVNTSDLRSVVMSARAVMEAAWGSLGGAKAHAYRDWSRTEFGEAAAEDLADVYEKYFQAPACPLG